MQVAKIRGIKTLEFIARTQIPSMHILLDLDEVILHLNLVKVIFLWVFDKVILTLDLDKVILTWYLDKVISTWDVIK